MHIAKETLVAYAIGYLRLTRVVMSSKVEAIRIVCVVLATGNRAVSSL